LRSGDHIAFTSYRALKHAMVELLAHVLTLVSIFQPAITVLDKIFCQSGDKRGAPKAALVSLAKPSSQRRQS